MPSPLASTSPRSLMSKTSSNSLVGPGRITSEGEPHMRAPAAEGGPGRGRPQVVCRRWDYPPGCVTPFTLSVYGAYCATCSVRSW